MRVLIGEDDPDMLDITSYALRKYGFEVVCAADGITLLERWRTEPRLVGLQFSESIRESAPPLWKDLAVAVAVLAIALLAVVAFARF